MKSTRSKFSQNSDLFGRVRFIKSVGKASNTSEFRVSNAQGVSSDAVDRCTAMHVS